MRRIQLKEIEAEERGLYEEAVRAYGLDVKAAKGGMAGREVRGVR